MGGLNFVARSLVAADVVACRNDSKKHRRVAESGSAGMKTSRKRSNVRKGGEGQTRFKAKIKPGAVRGGERVRGKKRSHNQGEKKKTRTLK